MSDPTFTGRVTVPVLWDTKTNQIVNNESSEIIRMFNSSFDQVGAAQRHREERARRLPDLDTPGCVQLGPLHRASLETECPSQRDHLGNRDKE